jgi:hypothetical protein
MYWAIFCFYFRYSVKTLLIKLGWGMKIKLLTTHFSQELFSAETVKKIRFGLTREAIFLILYMAACAMVLNIFMQTRSLEEGDESFGFAVMLNGTAKRPYVYRQLVPMIANYVVELIPEEDRDAFVKNYFDKYHLKEQYFAKSKYANQNIEPWTPSYAIKFHIAYLIMFLSLVGLAYLLRLLVGELIQGTQLFVLTMPILFLLMLPMSFMHGNFFYDFPELFFLCGLLLATAKGHYKWWIILLPMAILNKESNILVPLLYLPIMITNANTWHKKTNILFSIAISLAAYFYIKSEFSWNSGGTVDWQLWQNTEFWLTPKNYFLWHDFYVPMIQFPRGINILFMALLASLFMYEWQKKPQQIKNLLIISLLINIPLWLMFCYTDEMRNLSFTFLPAFLVASHSLRQLLDKPSFHPNIKSE